MKIFFFIWFVVGELLSVTDWPVLCNLPEATCINIRAEVNGTRRLSDADAGIKWAQAKCCCC